MSECVIVVDFGGQYNQLIARRVRECHVYSEIVPYTKALEAVREKQPKGVIFTGGPNSCLLYTSVAIDFNEDPPYLGLDAARKIRDICRGLGAQAKISSIHVNAWYGDYDKVSMARLYLTEQAGEKEPRDSVLFFGDSPNDEPMFAYFPLSCAVANIKPFAKDLTHLPAYVTTRESGAGFADAADHLLALRASGG